jgi:ribosomal-protein-alanine N-acetyltransferase
VTRGVLLRRARAADAPALARLERACFTHPWTEAQLADEIAGVAPGTVLVLEGLAPEGGARTTICGYGSFRSVLDELHVMNVAVAPGFRRRGLARWLLTFAMGKARRAGARRALLEVRAGNGEALALYQSLGFRRVSVRRGYYRDPLEDALVLSRDDLDGFRGRAAPEP